MLVCYHLLLKRNSVTKRITEFPTCRLHIFLSYYHFHCFNNKAKKARTERKTNKTENSIFYDFETTGSDDMSHQKHYNYSSPGPEIHRHKS